MVPSAPVEYVEFGPSDGSHSRAAGGKRTLSKEMFDLPGPWGRSVVPVILREVRIGLKLSSDTEVRIGQGYIVDLCVGVFQAFPESAVCDFS